MNAPRVCGLPGCGTDLDRYGLRADADYCSEAHSKRHRRQQPDPAKRAAERAAQTVPRTGMRPPTRYAICKVVKLEPLTLEVVGYRRANKAERAVAASRRSPKSHVAIPARDLSGLRKQAIS